MMSCATKVDVNGAHYTLKIVTHINLGSIMGGNL